MPEMTSYAPGSFCWADLATTDAAGAKNFYSQLLGWSFVDNPAGEGMIYSMCQKEDKNICGLYQVGPDMAAMAHRWNSYISVPDVDARAERVTAAGGSLIEPPFDVSDTGRMAFATDVGGAPFGLWQPKEHIGAQLMYQPGALGRYDLYSNDPEASASFYNQVFGWSRSIHDGAGASAQGYHEFMNGENPVGRMLQIQPEWGEVPPNWSIYFCLEDCEAGLAQAQSLGAEVVVPIMQVLHTKFAFIKDPQGTYVGIVQVLSQP